MDLTRATEDFEAGRLWKARDRLQGHRAAAPADQEVLELLGLVHYAMGALPAAGLAWLLTAREGEDVDAARAAPEEERRRGFATGGGRARGDGEGVDAASVGCFLAIVAGLSPWAIGLVQVVRQVLRWLGVGG